MDLLSLKSLLSGSFFVGVNYFFYRKFCNPKKQKNLL